MKKIRLSLLLICLSYFLTGCILPSRGPYIKAGVSANLEVGTWGTDSDAQGEIYTDVNGQSYRAGNYSEDKCCRTYTKVERHCYVTERVKKWRNQCGKCESYYVTIRKEVRCP